MDMRHKNVKTMNTALGDRFLSLINEVYKTEFLKHRISNHRLPHVFLLGFREFSPDEFLNWGSILAQRLLLWHLGRRFHLHHTADEPAKRDCGKMGRVQSQGVLERTGEQGGDTDGLLVGFLSFNLL